MTFPRSVALEWKKLEQEFKFHSVWLVVCAALPQELQVIKGKGAQCTWVGVGIQGMSHSRLSAKVCIRVHTECRWMFCVCVCVCVCDNLCACLFSCV